MYEEMINQINKWDEQGRFRNEPKQDWIEAADNWRLPYWDWAREQTYISKFAVPEVLTLVKVKVQPPGDLDVTYIWNPLWEFENPMKAPTGEPLSFGDVDMGQWRIRPDFVDFTICDKKERYAVSNRIRVSN